MFDLEITREQKWLILGFGLLLLAGIGVGLWRERSGADQVVLGSSEHPVQVEISGAVEKPGVYQFKPGTRIWEALRSAGKMPEAQLSGINLAEPLKDGQKIFLPEDASAGSDNGPKPQAADKIDLNRAEEKDLDAVPGIGTTTAKKIIALRDQKGGFRTWDDLKAVPRLGAKTIERFKQYFSLDAN